jgi:hypothetical protein
MGGSVREEWDAPGLACARLQDRTDPSTRYQVNICYISKPYPEPGSETQEQSIYVVH